MYRSNCTSAVKSGPGTTSGLSQSRREWDRRGAHSRPHQKGATLCVQCSLSVTHSIIPKDRKFWQSIMRMTDTTGLIFIQKKSQKNEHFPISRKQRNTFTLLKRTKFCQNGIQLDCFEGKESRYPQYTGIMSTAACTGEFSLCL